MYYILHCRLRKNVQSEFKAWSKKMEEELRDDVEQAEKVSERVYCTLDMLRFCTSTYFYHSDPRAGNDVIFVSLFPCTSYPHMSHAYKLTTLRSACARQLQQLKFFMDDMESK